MFGSLDEMIAASAPRVSVRADQLDALVDKVRALPCTDYKCRNASPAYTRTCARCETLALVNSIERRNV